ncbi:unnamed protein product [Pylaiella littoralis]
MQRRRRERGDPKVSSRTSDGGVGSPDAVTTADASPAVQLRAPRHGGWKGFRADGREGQMLRGEPGYHLGLFRIVYGVLLVQRTLAFMSSGAVDASFARGDRIAPSPQGAAAPPTSVMNFGHGFLLLGGDLGSPTADTVRTACWCLCAAGAAISVGFRPNAAAFAASFMQLCLLLLEKSVYSDEAYLFALVGLLLSFTDCGKTLGLEAPSLEDEVAGVHGGGASGGTGSGRGGAGRNQPPDTVPHWHVVLLRFQVCIVHIHRGLAKAATLDWLVRGQPLLHTLETLPPAHLGRRAAEWVASSEIPGFGGGGLQALAIRLNGSMIFVHLFLGLSLLAAPHYRPAAVVLQTAIHLVGAVFGGPHARAWHLLIAATGVLFVDATSLRETIERTQAWLQPAVAHPSAAAAGRRFSSAARRRRGGGSSSSSGSGSGSGAAVAAAGGAGAGAGKARESEGGDGGSGAARTNKKKKLPLQPKPSSAAVALISIYVLAQALLPLRHVLGQFPAEWSREGHEFSWRGGGGGGGRGGGGGLVREEGLVRVMHRPRGRAGSAAATGVQTVHLYGAPLTAQQVLRLVLDPDMLLQLAKKSAVTSPTGGGGGRGGRGRGRGQQQQQQQHKPRPPYSHVDAWKSINGRPFARWIDPTVDVWDTRFEGDGPPNAEWLELPPLEAELDRAAGVMEAVREKWAMKDQRVTFFAARSGQAGLSNVFLGGYDPSNFNTTELCAVPARPGGSGGGGRAEKVSAEDAGGILFGVAMGEVELMTEPETKNGQQQQQMSAEPESRVLKVGTGTISAPTGRGHTVRAAGVGRGRLAVWYYVHSCPDGLFHLCVGFLSGAGWEQLYPGMLGIRKGWTWQNGMP